MDELGLGAAATQPLIDLDPTLPAVLADKSAVLLAPGAGGEELYAKWKRLEGHEEFLDLQEVRPRRRRRMEGGASTGGEGRAGGIVAALRHPRRPGHGRPPG